MHFALGFYEAFLGLLNPTDKEVWCLDLYFPLASIWIYDDTLFFVNNKVLYFRTLQIMHLPLKNKTKKQQEQVTKKFSQWKQAHVGMEPSKTNQTRWEWHHNTFHHPYILCQLCLVLVVCIGGLWKDCPPLNFVRISCIESKFTLMSSHPEACV